MSLARGLFHRLSMRERFLLTAFLWVALLIWVVSIVRSLNDRWAVFSATGSELGLQAVWFGEQATIEEQLGTALQRLDPAKTYNSAQLSARLDTIARQASLSFDLSSPSTQDSGVFSIHSVRVQVRRAKMSELIQFDETIRSEFPNMGLESFQVSAFSRDPRYLDATFQVYSFELKPLAP